MLATTIDNIERATRLARAIASDIAIYNDDKVKQGIQQDTFFDLLSPELQEGLALYTSRVSRDLDAKGHIYWQAIVNVIINSTGHLLSNMW